MATGGVPNIFECAVCLNSMLDKSPRGLKCFHTFCEECLIPLIKNKQIVCPSCRKVTTVEKDDVKQLPVNFFLCQIKDLSFPKDTSYSTATIKSELLCEICRNTAANYKCTDCSKKLCTICKRKHSSIRKYKEHVVLELCADHHEVVEKFCKKCLIPLCASCISNHTGLQHDEHMRNYDIAKEELEKDVATMKQNIANAENEYDDSFDETIMKHQTHKEVLIELNKRRKYYADKVKEADRLIKETEDKIGKFKQLEIEYEETRFECEDLKLNIEKLDDERDKFQKFSSLKIKVEETVNHMTKKFEEYDFPSFVLCKHQFTKLAIPRPPKQVQRLQKVKLLTTITGICKIWNFNKQLASAGEDILAIEKEEPSHVIRINQLGETVDRFYPKENGEIIGVNSDDDWIYILQEKFINVVQFEEGKSTTKVYRPNIETMGKIFVVDSQNILISEYKSPGSIYWFNTVRNSTTPVVKALNSPSYISTVYTEDGFMYIISETGAHCVRVYTETWDLLYTIGNPGTCSSSDGNFKYPIATAVTEQNTVLVADQDNKRVCHFTLDGTFLSHVVTEQDDIDYPVGLVYMDNVLWSTFWSGNIKCFQLQYDEQ